MIPLFRSAEQPAITETYPSGPYLFNQSVPTVNLRVSVIVPVKNEADHLRHTLDALRRQYQRDGSPLPYATYEVLLLTNNCTDQSYQVARQYQTQFPDFSLHVANIRLTPDKAHIGHVRRLLMDEACRRLLLTGNRLGIIASTDGDTVVDHHWISQTITEIDNGNDAVGGRILTRPAVATQEAKSVSQSGGVTAYPSDARRYHLLDVTYRHLIAQAEAELDPLENDPWPRHFQHFGASLAVTCEAYMRAGRLPEAPYLEDEAFYRALLRIDARVRKSPQVRVFTSTRLQGRVAVGFSWQLHQWAALKTACQLPLVESADVTLNRFRNRKKLRDCWQTMAHTDRRTDLLTLATDLHLDPDWLCRETATNQYFGQLYERVEQQLAVTPNGQNQALVPVTTAIHDLRDYLRSR